MEEGRGLALLASRMRESARKVQAVPELTVHAAALEQALHQVLEATRAAWATGVPGQALANAVPYMQAFGHTVLAWIWLDVAHCALLADRAVSDAGTQGRLGAARFFFHYELPKIGAWLQVVSARETCCADLPENAF